MNKHTHPLKFIPQEIDDLKAEVEELKQEIQRLKETKADRKGRKKNPY